MKRSFLAAVVTALVFFSGAAASTQHSDPDPPEAFAVAFYNLENLFDTINQNGDADRDFTPRGKRKWNSARYHSKISRLAHVLSCLRTPSTPLGPAIIGLSEVENQSVLEDLVSAPALADRNLKFIHRDSPDPRGIDVALLYDPALFNVTDVTAHQLRIPGRPDFQTRLQLCVIGQLGSPSSGCRQIAIIVNHWPSRRGGQQESSYLREAAANLNRQIADSLYRIYPDIGIITMGDLNDDPYNKAVSQTLGAVRDPAKIKPGGFFNPFWMLFDNGYGSYIYRGSWNLFDQIIVNSNITDGSCGLKFHHADVFNRPFLLQQDGRYKGYPLRTFSGGVWTDGFSDHLPTQIFLLPSDDQEASLGKISPWAGTINNTNDDIFYQAASRLFSIASFRIRGLQPQWHAGYINGVDMNSPMSGRFFYSSLGGMYSSAFRNRSTEPALDGADYAFNPIGGSDNFSTLASGYAPGWRGNLAYTNSAYMLRAMLQYSSGVSRNGWAFSSAIIGRYAPEGAVEGTFYNSFGYFLALEKIFNPRHSLNLSTWGAPTQRAFNSAATQEAFDLAGSNLYNPAWGYLNGKKKASRIAESFDPSLMLNWLWHPSSSTALNTGIAARANRYSISDLNWYQAADPRPDYYRNMPSWFNPTADKSTQPDLYDLQLRQQQFVADWWSADKAHRQIDWNSLYQTNLLNRTQYDRDPDLIGLSTYILEDRHSDFNEVMLNSTLRMQLNQTTKLTAGISANLADAHYFKTIRDLLGGEFWRDVDNFSERYTPSNPDLIQNDLDNPDRRVTKGDTFGYDYHIRSAKAKIWAQNQFENAHWRITYAAELDASAFRREGMMRNGRAPGGTDSSGSPLPASKGLSPLLSFFNGALRAGAILKINGRNSVSLNAEGGSRAPLPENIYVSPRTKQSTIENPKSEAFFSADFSYDWNFPIFRGTLSAFHTMLRNGTRRYSFFDYELNSFMNYALNGISTNYTGLELGMEFKLFSNFSISTAGTLASYRYANNPDGIRNYENGAEPDVKRTVFLKGYHVGGTPQQAFAAALKYNKSNWFYEVNATWLGQNRVELSPTRHEEMSGLRDLCSSDREYEARLREITRQEMLNHEWVMNLSVGKLIYTRAGLIHFNLSLYNVLNNRNIQVAAWQDGKFDFKSFDPSKFPNKIRYAQGFRAYFNVGFSF